MDWDVIVVGAGPAGSSVATYLAREGRRVLLLDRERFPREHIGESLLPGVLPYLDALGVRDEVEREGFVRKEGQTFIWGRDRTPWELDFRELDSHPYTFFVERARFDEILARHAARSGAVFRDGSRVREILFESGRAAGVVVRDEHGTRAERARFVVDASGQGALVARGAGLRKLVRGLKNLAVWSYWRGARRLPGHAARHIFTVSIESGWIWCIPLRDRLSVGVVTSFSSRLGEGEPLDAWYETRLRACAPIWELLSGAERVEPVSSARDWSYRSRRTSGPGILLCGDAACFVDPILSTGVHLAMTSAYWAAACIHSSLSRPAHEPVYRRFYDEQYATTFRELLAQVKSFYRLEGRRDSVYWQSRAILRVHDAIPSRLAFLFVTAGLLRNAAQPEPNRVGSSLARALGDRAKVDDGAPPQGLVPPRALRLGPDGRARLVTLRQQGLDLQVVPHVARSAHDQPRGRAVALELADADREPIALAVVAESAEGAPRSSRWTVHILPYPLRDPDDPRLAAARAALERIVEHADDPSRPLRAHRLRTALRRATKAAPLPAGLTIVDPRSFRSPRIDEPPVTLVLATPEPSLPRLYVRAEPRLPPESIEIAPLRMRFVDVWIEPGRDRDGTPVERLASVRALTADLGRSLAEALRGSSSTSESLDRAEACLRALSCPGYSTIACGRILPEN